MKYLKQVRDNTFLFLLGLRMSRATQLEMFLAIKSEQCGGHCLCIEYDGTAPAGNNLKLLQAGSDGECPSGSVPITNTIGEIEAQLDACACANRLANCLCAEFPAAAPG